MVRPLLGLAIALGATGAAVATGAAAVPRFADRAAECGVDFVHLNGASGNKYATELLGAGGGLLDFDGDGDLDLYLVQGAGLPGQEYPAPQRNRLYERVGSPAAREAGAPAPVLEYRAVPSAAGADDDSYGMGCAVGDYDNDGDPDLYVTNFGANRLYRNDCGKFTDVTAQAGVGDPRWSMSAVFFDADGDGLLDLYVCNYFRYAVDDHQWYGLRKDGYRTHGGPASFRPEPDIFYRNLGGGAFVDATEAAGFAAVEDAHALGIVAGDLDDDGDVDLYVANDTQPNWLFLNDGEGRFTEDGMVAGVSFDQSGAPQAGMGVDAQDANGDRLVDLFVTNFSLETNTLYLAEGGGFFVDASYAAGLGAAALPYLGFGTGFFDPDNDGDRDVFVANGHIMDNAHLYYDNLSYMQPNQLYVNGGDGTYQAAGPEWGGLSTRALASRSAIFGDLDDDGDTDLVVTNVAEAPEVLVNDGGNDAGWIRVQLRGSVSNRDGYGADVFVQAGGEESRQQVRAAFSYLGSSDPRPLIGLAGAEQADLVEVRWPSGAIDRAESVPAGRTILFVEGDSPVVLPEGVASVGFASVGFGSSLD